MELVRKMTMTKMTNPGKSGLDVLPTGTLPPHWPGEGAPRGPKFLPANLLPKIRVKQKMTLILSARGERDLGVISFWQRVTLVISRGALATLLFILVDMGEATLPTHHPSIQPLMWAVSICLR
jgi:hypothetical protein